MSDRRRWQPPPMSSPAGSGMNDAARSYHQAPNAGPDSGHTPSAQPVLKVDERMVRKMLEMNPAMRAGRTTFQVKRALEDGGTLGGGEPPPTGNTQPPGKNAEARTVMGGIARTASHNTAPNGNAARFFSPGPQAPAREAREDAEDLGITLDFFLRTKVQRTQEKLADIETRRRALEQESATARQHLVDGLLRFLRLLDSTIVHSQGRAALLEQQATLETVGVDLHVDDLLRRLRNGG